MAATNYAGIGQRTNAWADSVALKHAEPVIVLGKFALSKPVPKNKANNVIFRRPNIFAIDGLSIAEGVNPTPEAMTYTDVPVTLATFGHSTQISQEVADMVEDPVLADASALTGEWGASTKERILWNAITGGTSVTFANGVANRAGVATAITLNDIRVAVRGLNSAKTKRVTKILDSTIKISTRGVEAAYVAVCHTDLEGDIRNLTGFIPTAQYGSRAVLCPEELGSVENVRFITSPELTPTAAMATNAGGSVLATYIGGDGAAATANIYPIVLLGQDSFGDVALKGSSAVTMKVINPGTPSAADVLGRYGYVSGSFYSAATILNESWMNRIEVLATK
ncbi:MAG: N4-gp56 family major capsid protein [Gallionellaceae bacterium]